MIVLIFVHCIPHYAVDRTYHAAVVLGCVYVTSNGKKQSRSNTRKSSAATILSAACTRFSTRIRVHILEYADCA